MVIKCPVKNKKIVITGGSGFIGSCLVRELSKDNHVTIIDIFAPDLYNENIDFVNMNLLYKNNPDEQNKLKQILLNKDIIIHCASIAGIDRTIQNSKKTLETNILAAYNLLCCLDKPELVIMFSTSEVFGDNFNTMETSQTKIGSLIYGRWCYAMSKLAGEHLAYAFYKSDNTPIVILRPFNIFGPGQKGEGAVHCFIERALKNEDIYINGDGSQIRSWCYIDDMVNSVLLIIKNNEEKSSSVIGESFNIGNRKNTITIYNLAKLIIKLLGSKSKIKFKPELEADIMLRIPVIDKAMRILDFEPQTELEDGILLTAEYYREKV